MSHTGDALAYVATSLVAPAAEPERVPEHLEGRSLVRGCDRLVFTESRQMMHLINHQQGATVAEWLVPE